MSQSPFYKTSKSKSPLTQTLPGLTETNKSDITIPTDAKSGTTDFQDTESRQGNNKSITATGVLEAASYAPVIGTGAQVAIAANEAIKGNYKDALMAGIFAIPGAKLLKGAGKLIKTSMKAFSNTPKQYLKKGLISPNTYPTSKNHPNYFREHGIFSDIKKDGSQRLNTKKSVFPSTRKGTGDVPNWKTTKKDAQKQLDEQLKKMNL